MDALYAVLRIAHIVAAAFWFGAAALVVLYLEPAVRATAPDGQKVMGALVRGGFNSAMSAAAGITILAGAVLFGRASGWFQAPAWFGTPTGIAWSTGGALGLAAFLLGIVITAPTVKRLTTLGGEIQAQGAPPTPEQRATLGELQGRMRAAGWANVALLAAALVLMAIARAI